MNERLRAYIYRIATPIAGLMVAYGHMTDDQAGAWLKVIGAVLLVAEGGLAARNTSTDKGTPENDVPQIP